MKISGKISALVLFVIFIGIAVWLDLWEPLSPYLSNWIPGMHGNSKQPLKAEDFDFKSVQLKDIQQKVLATGTITLRTGAEVKIGARISGRLENLRVQIGDFVHKGDLIAVIEHEDLQARVMRFRADLNAEEARLDKIRGEGPLEINKARAELEELEVQARLAGKMLDRNHELNKKSVVSQTVVDEAEEKVEVLKSKIKLAHEVLKLKEEQLKHDIKLAEAMVARAKASLQEQETELSYAHISAVNDGIVAFISTQEGETVVAGMSAPTFVTLIDLRKLEATVFVDETDIGRIQVGQNAVFTVDTYADKLLKGSVRDIHPKAVIKDNVVNYEAILEIDPQDIALLRPEMTANVVIVTGIHPQVSAIPREALKRAGDQNIVIVKVNGTLVEKPIVTGWRDGDFIEVNSGLKENDEVGIPKKSSLAKEGPARKKY